MNPTPVTYRIYLITCLVNGKVYVGQTRQRMSARMDGYRRDMTSRLDCNRPIVHALRKHGWDAFSFSELDQAATQAEANEKERQWIAAHRSTDREHGYNVQSGGVRDAVRNGAMRKAIECVETGETFSSMAEAARAQGFSPAALTLHMKGISKTCNGYTWRWTGNKGATIYDTSEAVKAVFEQTRERQRRAPNGNRAPVRCVETGETFPSSADAARRYGVDKRVIYGALERGISAAGLHWTRLKPKGPHNSRGHRKRPVRATETDTVYPSLAEAAMAHGVSSTSIWCAIRDGGTCHGLHWSYVT